ncbi:MAG TPA: hypothetical protein VK450_03530, partial [Methanomicrobiales archaeon]|nr:hypothetical protein [Methanomicrobiales archaeon]
MYGMGPPVKSALLLLLLGLLLLQAGCISFGPPSSRGTEGGLSSLPTATPASPASGIEPIGP